MITLTSYECSYNLIVQAILATFTLQALRLDSDLRLGSHFFVWLFKLHAESKQR